MSVAAAPRAGPGTDDALPAAGAVREMIALAVVSSATFPALAPLAAPGLAATHDGFLHVQRLIAVEAAIREGAPLTRWLPDLAYGYGQPLLLYYAPLSYLPAIAARLLGAGYVASFELASGLALVLAALAMYLLARALFGLVGAVVAATVYALLPYQLVDLYVRGALAESWAFVWLPLAAWCLVRAWTDRRPRWSVGLALTVAALVLTHNVTALLFLPTLVALALILAVGARGAGRTRRERLPARPAAAVALGLGLSAWFWLPSLAERDLVQIGELIEPALFASFFVREWPPFRLDLLYDYQRPVSTALGSPIFWPQLGLVQAVVTVVGAVVVARASGLRRAVGLWAVLLAVGGYFLQLQPLMAVYERVPLLAFVQFPWRLLALVGLGSALLAGLLVETVSARAAIRVVFAAAVVGASVVTAVARLDPEPVLVDERLLSIETIGRAELADYGLGATHSGEYLPVTSGQRNSARFRKTMLEAGGSQPDGPRSLQVERAEWQAGRVRVVVSADRPERLTLRQLAFPGWTASLDGKPAEVVTSGELGLIGVEMPAGRHVVEVVWGWTPLRAGAGLASLLALALLAPLAAGHPRRPGRRTVGVVAGLAVLALAAVVLPGQGWTQPASAPDATPRPVGHTMALVEAHHDGARLASDGLIVSRLTLFVRQPPPQGLRAFVEAVADDGAVHRAPLIFEPLSRLWSAGELLQATVAVRLPPSFPGGMARLRLAVERPAGVEAVPLGTIRVPAGGEWRASSPRSDLLAVAPGVALAAGAGPATARAGEAVDLPLIWHATGAAPAVERELLVVAALTTPGGDVLSEPRRPGDWFAPLPFWQQGDRVEQRVRLTVPQQLAPGAYPLEVRVYARDLARGGASEPGAALTRPRGRPIHEAPLGTLTVTP